MDEVYEFGPFRLEAAEHRLLKNGEPVPVRAKLFDTLHALVSRQGSLVTKEELMAAVWPDSVVEEGNLAHNITALRKILGDNAADPRYIETVSGVGYRFKVPQATSAAGLGAPEVRLVEREGQLEELRACLDQARQGRRQLICIPGESGAGKTALVNAFLSVAQASPGVRIGRGWCLEFRTEADPYMPILEALSGLCRDSGDGEMVNLLHAHAPSWLLQIPSLVDAGRHEDLERRTKGATGERMLREFAEVIERASADCPLILAIEDLHWSDPSTLALLEMMAKREEPARLMLMATYRPADAAEAGQPIEAMAQALRLRGACRVVQPSGLSAGGVARLLREELVDSALPEELAAAVWERTGGNPLFVIALADHWRSTGDRSPGAIPGSLRTTIERMLERLDAQERQLLEVASVAGEEFPASVVAQALTWTEDEAETKCANLARIGGVLREGGAITWPDGSLSAAFEFVHAMYREVLYTGLSPGIRARWHRKVGEVLERSYGRQTAAHAGEMAGHFVAGRDAVAAVRYLRQAADQAMRRSAYREAVGLLRQGLELIQLQPDAPERWPDEMAFCAMLAPAVLTVEGLMSGEAEQCFRRARELGYRLGSFEEMYPLLLQQANMHELRGEYSRAQEVLEERSCLPKPAKSAAVSVDSDSVMACSLFHQGEFERAVESAEHALRLYDPQEHVHLIAQFGENPAVVCNCWAALSLWCLGHPDKAAGRAWVAIQLAEKPDHLFSLAGATVKGAQVFQLRREVATAGSMAAKAVQLSREHGYLYDEAFARALLGWTRAAAGAHSEGISLLETAIHTLREIGAGMDLPYLLAMLAEAHAAADDPHVALELINQALALVRNSRTFFYEAELYRLRGALLLQARHSAEDEAEASFRMAIEIARRKRARSLELRAATSLCLLWRNMGRREEGEQMLTGIWRTFDEGKDTPDLREAEALLPAVLRANSSSQLTRS